MEKKNLDWSNLTFSYQKTDKRFVANYTNGAWDEGALIDDDKIVAFFSESVYKRITDFAGAYYDDLQSSFTHKH